MGSEEERTCPMCMEVMDLTDQQLKPCQCGYEICVWCWHNIVQMAEKDDTVGRCPACRSPYDKERILGMTISNERMTELNSQKKKKCKDIKPAKVNPSKQEKMQKKSKEACRNAEIDSEKKNSQWAKVKPLEVRTHLSDVRVIQRNIVYIAGWPVSLAVEETCRKKEFLGQYGNIKRVDIIRTDVSKKHYPATCVLFIAFSKEEEAIRCIQAVNGYTLDGRSLKACFGATGYCKAWLKNMRCVNPDCLFLHRVGPQEDVCSRHEVTTACVSKFQQWSEIGFSNSKKSSGKCLPPPVDNCSTSNHTTSKPLAESIRSPNGDVQSFNQNYDTRRSGDLSATFGARSASLEPSNCHSVSMTSIWSSTAKEANIAAQTQDISKSILKSAMDSSTNTGQVFDECSSYSALSTGLSGKELGVSHSAPPGCGSQNLKSGKPFPVHKDVVQDPGLLAKVNGDSRENIRLTKKAIEEIKEDKVTSDILTLNLSLVEPHRLAKQSAEANKKDKSLKDFANDIMEKSDTGREMSSLYSNGFYQRKKSDYMDTGGEKAVDNNRPLLGLNAYDVKHSEVPKNSHTVLSTMASKEFQLTSSVHPSGSSVSRRLVSPVPRYPPGFHPRHAADRDQPSMTVLSGPIASYPFPGYSPHVNFSQDLSSSNFVGSELHDPAKVGFSKEKLPQATLGLNSCNWDPNLFHPAEMDGGRQFELRLRNLTENSIISMDRGMEKLVDNILIEETMQSNHSHREPSRLGNPVAAVSRVADTSYSRTPLTDHQAPNLEQQSPRPFYDPEFEASNFSYFSYSQYKKA